MIVFETDRLSVRSASVEDAWLYYALWTDPKVMTNVGYPEGVRISVEEIEKQLEEQEGKSAFGRNLVVMLQHSETPIGECKLYRPNPEGIAKTDIKLLPEVWGNRYGVEVKKGLLDYLFRNSDCEAVEGTPNVANAASIKMQEAVGGIRVGEEVYHFPESMQSYTHPVHHHVYLVKRGDWQRRQDAG